ncbi:MAG: tyrosine-type recombinase/integrase [Burkholderiales bacterium]|nr:tyrosine-type recombinase/integrase [Burkholderiales bacterium]
MKLTDVKLRSLAEPGRYWDGRGLYLEVHPAGGRYWRMKYRHDGKERRAALGVYPEVPLKLARDRAEAARAILARGRDPVAVWQAARELQAAGDLAGAWRDAAELLDAGDDPAAAWRERKAQAERDAAATFEAVAREWLGHQSGRWGEHTATIIRRSLEADVFPKLGARPMAELRPREVMTAIKAIEGRGAGETAGRVLQRVKAVFRYAVVHERIASNPMLDLKPAEILKPRTVRHRAALDDKALPPFLAVLDAYGGEPSVTAALRLLMLTAVRPGELRGARWAEIDTAAAMWRVPAERMKMKAAHLVPLSRQALEVLAAQRRLSGTDPAGLVFPSPWYPGKALSENTMNSALARMGYKGEHSAHGFRALFSTVCNEHGHDRDVIERTLAHVERNEVRAAYHRAAYLDQRRKLLQWWADYLDTRKAGGKVLKLRRGRA